MSSPRPFPFHSIPPDQMWMYRQAMEDHFAEEARRLMAEMDVTPVSRRNVKTNDLSALPDYDQSNEEAVRRAEVKNIASRLVDKLREKDERNDTI